MVAMLREASAKRVQTNKDFEKLAGDIARYEKRKDEKTISLEGERVRAAVERGQGRRGRRREET